MVESWAANEVRRTQFPDKRLGDRLIQITEALAAKPTASVPEACGLWSATKAAYRFWDSERVTPAAIRAGHREATIERMQEHGLVLAVQDTTDLDFTHHPATKGLGPLEHPALRGLKVHSVLSVSEQGVPLGSLHQAGWARDPEQVGKRHQRRQRETKDKESQRWLTALQASEEGVPESTRLVTLADREADIYDLFALPRCRGSELLNMSLEGFTGDMRHVRRSDYTLFTHRRLAFGQKQALPARGDSAVVHQRASQRCRGLERHRDLRSHIEEDTRRFSSQFSQ